MDAGFCLIDVVTAINCCESSVFPKAAAGGGPALSGETNETQDGIGALGNLLSPSRRFLLI